MYIGAYETSSSEMKDFKTGVVSLCLLPQFACYFSLGVSRSMAARLGDVVVASSGARDPSC